MTRRRVTVDSEGAGVFAWRRIGRTTKGVKLALKGVKRALSCCGPWTELPWARLPHNDSMRTLTLSLYPQTVAWCPRGSPGMQAGLTHIGAMLPLRDARTANAFAFFIGSQQRACRSR